MLEAVFHGHSFVELVTEHGSILIDPFVRGNSQCDCAVEDLCQKQIRAICLTHGHADHLGDTVEIANKTGCKVIAMVELAARLKNQWVQQCIECNMWGMYKTDGRAVTFVQAVHSSSTPDGQYAWLAAGLVFHVGNKTIYHAGDTALTTEMHLLKKYALDLAFLPIGDTYTMGIEDAVIATQYISARVVVPIHFDTFPIIKADAQEFARNVMESWTAVPKVLRPGQACVL